MFVSRALVPSKKISSRVTRGCGGGGATGLGAGAGTGAGAGAASLDSSTTGAGVGGAGAGTTTGAGGGGGVTGICGSAGLTAAWPFSGKGSATDAGISAVTTGAGGGSTGSGAGGGGGGAVTRMILSGSAGAAGWDLPMSGKTGTTEAHRSSGFVGFTNRYAAANYVYDDSTTPSDLCSSPLRRCGDGDLYGGNEPARTWFTAMKPIANNFGEVHLPQTDPRYVEGSASSQVPSVAGLDVNAARQRLKDAGFQVADQPTPVNSTAKYGEVVGTTPSGQTLPGSVITIQTSNGTAPAPPPPPVYQAPVGPPPAGPPPPVGSQVVEIPGLPPITIPLLAPPPPPAPPG